MVLPLNKILIGFWHLHFCGGKNCRVLKMEQSSSILRRCSRTGCTGATCRGERKEKGQSTPLKILHHNGEHRASSWKCAKGVKHHFDELCEDERLSDGESYFRINVFNANLDIIISQLSQRFISMHETNEVLHAIHPSTLTNLDLARC